MNRQKALQVRRLRRQRRVRKALEGTAERPRLAVFRSSKHIYAQIIDDQAGRTLVAASTVEPEVKTELSYGGNKAAAAVIGQRLAGRAREQGITQVCFDRRSYKFHGRVAALAEAARQGGLAF